MTFKFNIGGSSRQRETRRDTGAGNIVFLMMSLVFVPIVLAHVAVMASSQIFSAGQIQLASLMSLIISAVN